MEKFYGGIIMFELSCPPLLFQQIDKEHIRFFPSEAGYQIHPLSESQILVGYRNGWTFPLSVEQQKCVSTEPILLVRNSGGVTTSSGTTIKGYAHEFCQGNGQDPVCLYKQKLFPEQPDVDWMLIQDTVTMIWFQYGNKNQHLGDSGFVERIYYGKLLIRKFSVKDDIAPGFDKKADDISYSGKQFRVESHHIYLGGWNVATDDDSVADYLHTLLSSNHLDRYANTVTTALKRASGE